MCIIEIYKSRGGWRWRIKARNGRILFASEESHRDLSYVKRKIEDMKVAMQAGRVVVKEG